MQVKCIQLKDKFTKKDVIRYGNCSVGLIYDVLQVWVDLNDSKNSSQIVIEGDDKDIFRGEFNNFEFIDNSISNNFGFFKCTNDQICISPRSWYEYKSPINEYNDFWEDFHEGERSAIELYRKEVAFIKGETYEPLPLTKPDAKELLEIYRRRERDGLIPNQGFNEAFEPIALTSTENWKP